MMKYMENDYLKNLLLDLKAVMEKHCFYFEIVEDEEGSYIQISYFNNDMDVPLLHSKEIASKNMMGEEDAIRAEHIGRYLARKKGES